MMLTYGFRQNGVYEKSGSAVVYLSSAGVWKGQAAVSGYAASKGALVSMARALAIELTNEKIRVNCVCPGLVQTDMEAVLHEVLPRESLKRLHERHVLGWERSKMSPTRPRFSCRHRRAGLRAAP